MIQEVDALQDRVVKLHLLIQVCAKTSHSKGLCRAYDTEDFVRTTCSRLTSLFRIEIDKTTLLWNVIRSPWEVRYGATVEYREFCIPSNFITVPEPRHATGKSTKLALQGFGVPNFEDFTALFIASTDKDLSWSLMDILKVKCTQGLLHRTDKRLLLATGWPWIGLLESVLLFLRCWFQDVGGGLKDP